MFLGPEGISGNIFVSESYNFFYCISFADFLYFKKSEFPQTRLLQGAFLKILGF